MAIISLLYTILFMKVFIGTVYFRIVEETWNNLDLFHLSDVKIPISRELNQGPLSLELLNFANPLEVNKNDQNLICSFIRVESL